MKFATLTLIFLGIFLLNNAKAASIESYEQSCKDMGFKSKTEKFGGCVLELRKRDLANNQEKRNNSTSNTQKASKYKGDGSPDDVTCQKFGFEPSSTPYSQCRLQLDTAKRQLEAQQAQFNVQQEQYQMQKAEYDAKVADYKDRQDRKFWAGVAGMGFGMMEGKTPNDAYRQSLGFPPIAPAAPAFQNYSITMPGGRTANCTYTTVTRSMNCQ